ncbi:AzlD domain-containing protein [Leptolyngbya sp. AN02str]|uniref:AzlD domain-containing protein n=1 Tax=Leptolyngbya sp. AN02str TaxID=3423363 RepID=UPI003D3173D9
MNIWWTIVLAGIGTYLMRSVGVWLPSKFIPSAWLAHLPLAVILVLTISSLTGFTETTSGTVGAIAASLVVGVASWYKLPLVVCIALGCGVFGLLAGGWDLGS